MCRLSYCQSSQWYCPKPLGWATAAIATLGRRAAESAVGWYRQYTHGALLTVRDFDAAVPGNVGCDGNDDRVGEIAAETLGVATLIAGF